jgi:hypothetical protein
MERPVMPTGNLLVAERTVVIAAQIRPVPTKVLDVGCGYGKYGVLLREYIDGLPSTAARRGSPTSRRTGSGASTATCSSWTPWRWRTRIWSGTTSSSPPT